METNLKDINTKLVDISTQYSKFNKNQVLTETQLNGFIDYFEDQDRLSRTSLSGVGIVCGFKVSVENNNDSVSIKITQGRGVTTDGDLIALQKPSETEEGKKDTTLKNIQLDSRIYRYFKKFSDNEAEYGHFINADKEQINLWELFVSNADSRTKLASFPNEEEPSQDDEGVELNLSDMVVLLYLESYSKEDDLCSQLTCDSQGLEQVSRLRVLLVSEDDAKYIASKDGIYNKHDWYETYTSLPEVGAKRLILNTKNTKTFRRLKQSYYNTIKNNNVIKNLLKGLDLITEELRIAENTINPFIQRIFDFNDIEIPIDFQYRYDALKDFIDTYNEIKELLLDLNVHCCPNVGAFPKHLMLGKLDEKKPYATFRHDFYKSPIISCEDNNYKKLISLLTKLNEISSGYNLSSKGEEIKITPSKALDTLSNKAVPYYYHVTDSVLKHWNFEKNESLRHRFNLSYHTKNLVDVPSIQQPLDHNLDHFNFFRIEGHQGKTYREALEEITKIKEEKGLSFDVKVLSIETDNRSIELKDYKCQFEDLKILLDAWKAEQDCILAEVSNFFSSFSTEKAGINYFSESKGLNKEPVEKEKEELPDKEIDKQIDKIIEYEEVLEKIRKERLTKEEVAKIVANQKKINELEESGKTKEAQTLKEQYVAYLEKIEEERLSDEEKKMKIEYEKALIKYQDSLKNKVSPEAEQQDAINLLRSDGKDSRKKEAHTTVRFFNSAAPQKVDTYFAKPDEQNNVEAAKKEKLDQLWDKLGYRRGEEKIEKGRYNDIWSEIGFNTLKEATEREKKKQKNIVKEVLSDEENTIGKSFHKILEENPKASKNEILALFKSEMLEVSKGEAWKEKEDIKKFILIDTAEVLVNAHALDNEIPKEIEDIDKDSLSKYKVTIEGLCEQVKQLQASYNSLNLDTGTEQITGLLINQLSSVCCSGKKLEILYQEIEKRKANILIQTQLSEFVKNHPGLEHKAGVKPGGTFVMVYLKEAEEERVVYENVFQEIEFFQQPKVEEEGQGGEKGILQLWEEKYQISFTFVDQYIEESEVSRFEAVVLGKTIEETVKNLSEYFNKMFEIFGLSNQIKAGTKENVLLLGIVDEIIRENTSFIEFENPETIKRNGPIYFEPNKVKKASVTVKNTVVADFSLPYMCCSDCTPVNFIIPKEPVRLSLLEKHVCLKEGETVDPMEFKVSPANGQIAAIVPEGIQSGLTFDGHGKAYFDASLTDPILHGKEIGFTVDEELTDCTVIVYADVPLSVTTSVQYNALKTLATVTYKVSNVYPNLQHKWDFGNGTQSDQVPSTDGTIEVTYQLPLGDDNTAKPTLNVTNGICEKEVQIEPIIFDDAIEISLDIIESHCLDTGVTGKMKIPFTNKSPTGSKIKIFGDPIQGLTIENDELTIDSQTFRDFETPIEFTLEGIKTGAKITILKMVGVELNKSRGPYVWIDDVLHQTYYMNGKISEDSESNNVTYKWMLNGNKIASQSSIRVDFPLTKAQNEFEVILELQNKNGCVTTRKVNMSIKYPNFKLSMPDNKLNYCLNDEKYYPILVSPKVKGTKVNGLGVSMNAEGLPEFRAIDTNLESPKPIKISLEGKELLTLTLEEVSKAKFEWEIIDEVLYVKNTSEVADKYTFNIGEYTFDRVNRSTLKRSIHEFRNAIIDVSVTAHSSCGIDTHEEKGIEVRSEGEPQNGCVEETLTRIKDDNEQLPKDVDLPTDVQYLTVDQTTMLYDMILSTPQMLNDGMTSAIGSFGNLFTETANYIDKFRQNEYERGILSQYFSSQIKLFFNMLHCQPHDTLKTDRGMIEQMMEEMRFSLEKLRNNQIQFDDKNELKVFLKNFSESPNVIEYIKEAILNNILPEIL